MTKRSITPLEFAQLMTTAQRLRVEGNSTVASARLACIEHSITDDWSIPLLGFINDCPSAAEDWGLRMAAEAMDRVQERIG